MSDYVPVEERALECDACAEWSAPRAPFRLYGDAWYVGPDGLSSVLVRTDDGLVLLDGTLPESVPQIARHVTDLGFDVTQIRYLLVSHPHFDHAGGLAALQRRTGATVVTTSAGAEALRAGAALPDDPQAGYGDAMDFPPVRGLVRTLGDGETLTIGSTTFTLHATPGHTAGGASWSWTSCEGSACATLVYADSLNAVSAPGFSFTADPARLDAFRASIARVAGLDCDVLIPVHPSMGRLFTEAEQATRRGSRAFLDPRACRRYARDAERRLDARVDEEGAQ